MSLDFLAIFDRAYGPKLGVRASSFRAVLREAEHLKARSIVETGCIREKDNWVGDGQSTLILDHFAKFSVGCLTTVDISKEAIEEVRKILPEVKAVPMDSVMYLGTRKGAIDLLYLDSFDMDIKNDHPAALHCLFEFCAARPLLHPGSIVFIDDSPMQDGGYIAGKGRYVASYMQKIGVHPFVTGYQAAWIIP